MIPLDRGGFDPAVTEELAAALGPEAVDALMAAFETELRERPVTILQQVAAGDFLAASRSAHSLKGAALIVGARRIVSLAEQIEFGAPDRIGEHAGTLAALTGQ